MKKIINNVYGYICYITDLNNPLLVFGTFLRILVYFETFDMIFLKGDIEFGLLCLSINIISTACSISYYKSSNNHNTIIDKIIIKSTKRKYRNMQIKKRKTSYRNLSKEEKIKMLETFIEVNYSCIEDAKKELEELKREK